MMGGYCDESKKRYQYSLSVMIAVGIAVWITLTAHTPHTMDDYINHQYLIGVSSGIALILCIIRSYMPK